LINFERLIEVNEIIFFFINFCSQERLQKLQNSTIGCCYMLQITAKLKKTNNAAVAYTLIYKLKNCRL